jgi:hypothetical protein
MLRGKCTPKLSRPRIIQPRLEATAEEKEHAKRWAFELARIVMRAAEEGGAAHDPCSMVGRARKRLDAMSTKGLTANRAEASGAARPIRVIRIAPGSLACRRKLATVRGLHPHNAVPTI